MSRSSFCLMQILSLKLKNRVDTTKDWTSKTIFKTLLSEICCEVNNNFDEVQWQLCNLLEQHISSKYFTAVALIQTFWETAWSWNKTWFLPSILCHPSWCQQNKLSLLPIQRSMRNHSQFSLFSIPFILRSHKSVTKANISNKNGWLEKHTTTNY